MENRPGVGARAISGGGGRGGRSNPRTRKPRYKRSRRRDSSRRNAGGAGKRRGGNNNKRNKGPPSPPQTKIVIRKIGDVTKHGSVKDVVDLIRRIINDTNQKFSATTARMIKLDEPSVECLIQEEEAIRNAETGEARKKEEASIEQTAKAEHDNAANEETEADKEAKPQTCASKSVDVKDEVMSNSQGENRDGSVQDANSIDVSTLNLSARVVYIVPPKQTRRRGIKLGCAYLVISGPTIEEKDPVTSLPSDPYQSDPSKEEKKEYTEEEDANAEGENGNNLYQVSAREVRENHVVIVDPPSISSGPASSFPLVDYSRDVAKGRFLVIQAIDVMVAHVKADAKSDQKYAGSLVEVALSGKTYRHQCHRRDRREGTLETTADYKNFMDNTVRSKKELMARPKPAPGGVGQCVTSSTDYLDEVQPIAALVEHIRNKRAEASKRKKAKKKAKETANKDKGGGKLSRKKVGKEGGKDEGGKKVERKHDRKKRKLGKKKYGKGGTNTTQPAPAVVLKPGAAALGALGAATLQQLTKSLLGINCVKGEFQGNG